MRILYNANIYTLDPQKPRASAIVIQDEEIIALGDDQSILSEFPVSFERFDAQGSTIIPGLIDAHLHLQQYALSLTKVDCETASREECLKRVAERAQNTPSGVWILGHGWNQNNWGGGFSSAGELDLITQVHPVYLTAKSLHAAWVNSTALNRAGITDQTVDPPGGKIGRDEGGHPNGILFESAMQLVSNLIPDPKPAQLIEPIQVALRRLSAMGLTGLHDFDRRNCFTALQILHSRGDLKMRVTKSIPLEDLPHAVAIGLRSGFGDAMLRIGGVKAFSDGALGPRTAAMLQPYEGEPENRGILMLDAEELVEIGRQAVENGLSLAVHAIGDRANHQVLNAFSELRASEVAAHMPGWKSHLRHRIEHVQIIHPDDARRLAELGVIASMQPIHATSDMEMANRYWGQRSEFAYAWRTQLIHGSRLVFGSDAPVESPNPMWGLHAAITRRRSDGSPGRDGWYPRQRLTPLEAIQAFSTGPAYAAGMENQLGKLSPGYLADLVLLDIDPFTCEPDVLLNCKPLATMVAGEWIYQN
jgi:hypothetical protein